MNIDIYQCATDRTKFVSIRSGEDITKMLIPDLDFERVYVHRENMKIDPSDKRIAFSSAETIKAIEATGHYFHSAKVLHTRK